MSKRDDFDKLVELGEEAFLKENINTSFVGKDMFLSEPLEEEKEVVQESVEDTDEYIDFSEFAENGEDIESISTSVNEDVEEATTFVVESEENEYSFNVPTERVEDVKELLESIKISEELLETLLPALWPIDEEQEEDSDEQK